MKKTTLLIVTIILLGTFFISNKTIESKPKNYNVYIEKNGDYVKQNSNKMPTAGYKLNLSESSCTNGATFTQNISTKKISVSASKETKCNFYFDEYYPDILQANSDLSGSDYNLEDIIDIGTVSGSNCTNTLAFDKTNDENLRYVGSNPCNYVTFNGETAGWRIIGVMNNVDDGTGNLETRIKLRKKDSLGDYCWDTNATYNRGINDWTQADLKNELNGDYLDTTLNTDTNWYNGNSNQKTAVYDHTKGLKSTAQDLIGNAKWYLGGYPEKTNINILDYYTIERGTTTWSTNHTCNDGFCPRSLVWTGLVALIYPSDYLYAVGGNYREGCLTGTCTINQMHNNDWLFAITHTISPYQNTSNGAQLLYTTAHLYDGVACSNHYNIYPVVYLKSNIRIKSGSGTQTNPYEFELNT